MSIKQPLSELLTGEKKLSVILNPEYFKDLIVDRVCTKIDLRKNVQNYPY